MNRLEDKFPYLKLLEESSPLQWSLEKFKPQRDLKKPSLQLQISTILRETFHLITTVENGSVLEDTTQI